MSVESTPAQPTAFHPGAAIAFGWKRSWKNFWWLLLVAIILSAISGALNALFTWHGTPQYDFSNPSRMDMGQMMTGGQTYSAAQGILAVVGAVLQFLVTTWLALGVVRIALGVTTGDRVHIGKLFSFRGYGRYLGSSILVAIVVGIAAMVPLVIGIAITIAANQIAWVIIGALVAVLLGFVVSLFFCLFGYAILGEDAPGVSGLGRSWGLVKPHFWAILGLQVLLALIVIGIFIVAIVGGIFTLCIGLLATIPMAVTLTLGIPALAYAYTYRVLSGQPVS